jgi:hypothetical protein
MKYTISIAIDGRIDVEVDAVSFEEAKNKVNLNDVNLANMDIVGYNAVNATDENGVFIDY